MECGTTKEFMSAVAETAVTDSTETFQSFIYDLFEKNGILNDLRAYLRGHIVNVLKSAQTGDPPACQKNFTERLELTSQALNILIAEYLLRLEFSYSFSVFVSEIPLANMVFGFAKNLMDKDFEDKTELRFKDSDVWSILNYLGMQCDSEHASNIVEMYRTETQNPLLLCILKCLPMYKVAVEQVSSEESLSSVKSSDSADNKIPKNTSLPEKCKHYVFCKTCQNRMIKIKDKYKKKKKYLAKNVKEGGEDPVNMEKLIKNISVMEKSLIEEMFHQLKSVYETEVAMVKVEEEKKVKRSMATHALQMQKKRDEMEEIFRAREAELERSVQQKKRFLWGLARALRDQHQHMTRAMHDVRAETHRLSAKEDSLKTQLAEAEQILKKRGEEMRSQISNELAILEGHLESMKQERDHITRERSELENLKTAQEMPSKLLKIHNMDSEHIHSHYDLLQSELAILKKYLESTKLAPKCVIERGTSTEPVEIGSNYILTLNNDSQGAERCSKSDNTDNKVKSNLVLNDFKKKNVNFSQSNLNELYRERSRERSRSSGSSEAGDTAAADLELERNRDRDLIQRLREENERLKAFAREQHSHIARLSAHAPPQLRPRSAPAPIAPLSHLYSVNTTASANTLNVGWQKGAGEELSVFSNAQPRILVPGDTLPFIGVLRDRHGAARRPLACQSRGRGRMLSGVSKRAVSPHRDRIALGAGNSGLRLNSVRLPMAQCSLQQQEDNAYQSIRERLQQRPRTALSLEINRNREKSPKSVLREAKKKLRNKENTTIKGSPPAAREKSPNSVLREAKLRLRKLEIEAEAVEQSYLDFRRRQSALRLARTRTQEGGATTATDNNKLETKRSQSLKKLDEASKNEIKAQFVDLKKTMRSDFEKYIHEYEAKFDIGETHFKNKPTVAEKVKPIPAAYSSLNNKTEHVKSRNNYLEAPLTEFRKLYSSARQVRREDESKSPPRSIHSDNTSVNSAKNKFESPRHASMRKVKHDKQAELEILKQNITKMYNLPTSERSNMNVEQNPVTTHKVTKEITKTEDQNILRVEVESVSEVNDIKSQTQELLLVVQSSVNAGKVKLAESDTPGDELSTQMTIIVSPKRSRPQSVEEGVAGGLAVPSERVRRSQSPEQAAHLTRNDVLDAIFHANPDTQISSVQMQLQLSKDSISEYGKEEYPDDFSADVDNYNSRSDYEEQSPISLPKTPDDENFWDS